MGNANASSGDQFQDLAFPPDYPASVAFVLRNLKNQKDETDAIVNAVRSRVTVLEGIAETSSGRITALETAVSDRVKKSSIQSLDPSTIKLSPASIKEFLVTMVNAMKACFTLALLVPTLAFGGGKDIYGNDLTRTNKLGYVDGDLTTVGDLADFGAANPSVITSVVEGLVHPWARAKDPPTETDPTVPYWAKQLDPPAETDPTVKEWAKADNPPAETDPTVPAWAKAATPPTMMTTNTVDALANSAVVTNALTVATTNRVALLESSKADKAALAAHVTNTDNPHAVTAEQVGSVPFVEDVNGAKTAVTIGNRKDGSSVGYSSLAHGFNVNASGVFSIAEGQDTSSPGFCSHSEGYQTKASGDFSHTEGSGTVSNGKGSHAEGDNTFAFADYSHVEGRLAQTLLGHDYAYVWNGDGARSEPYTSHDLGTFNINPKDGLNGFWIGEQTLYAILANKADNAALEGKVSWDSDHLGVALGDGYLSAGPYSSLGSDSTIGSNATINDNALIGNTSGGSTFIGGWLHFSPERKLFSPALFTMGDQLIYTTDFGNSVMLYFPSKSGTIATTDDITNSISETNTVFSNAVLAVGLNIDTNSVAVLNEIAATFGGFPLGAGETATTVGALLAALAAAAAWLKKNKVGSFESVGGASATIENGVAKLSEFFTNSNSLLTGTIDEEIIDKGTAPDAHLEAPTDERLKLVLADNSVAYDSAKALPYKLTSVIGDRVVATMTLTAASTDITLPTIAANDTTVKDFILDVTNAYAVEGVATDAGINIPRTDFKLVTRDGESLTDVTTVKAGKSAFLCFTQKAPVVVGGTTYPCWCVIQLPFGDPS